MSLEQKAAAAGVAEEEEEEDFDEVEKLQNVGVNVSDIKKLKGAGMLFEVFEIDFTHFFQTLLMLGIHTVKGIWQSTMKTLTSIKGFPNV